MNLPPSREPTQTASMAIGTPGANRARRANRWTVISARRVGLASILFAALGSAPWASASDPPAPATQPKLHYLNLKRFEIPFNIDPTGQRPVEVQLQVSRDAGATWKLFASQAATAKHFLFETTEDGDYWFATRTLDSSGQTHPAGPIKPQLAVRVDTTDPRVEWETEVSVDGVISVALWYVDPTPLADSIRIEYSVDGSRPWIPVPDVATRDSGAGENAIVASATIKPADAWRQVTLRALVGDQAGNKTMVTRQIDRPRVAVSTVRLATTKMPAYGQPVSAPVGDPAAAEPLPLVGPPPSPATPLAAGLAGNSYPAMMVPYGPQSGSFGPNPGVFAPQVAFGPGSGAGMPSFAGPANAAGASGVWNPSEVPSASALMPDAAGVFEPSIPLNPAQAPPRPKTPAEAMRPLEESESSDAAAPATVAGSAGDAIGLPANPAGALPSAATVPPSGIPAATASTSVSDPLAGRRQNAPLPPGYDSAPVRHSGSRMFSLEYEIESAGLSGVNDVELWGTTDQGATWKRWGSDPDRQSPFDIETNHDGPYGFRIVVVSNTGLATPRPLAGDAADMVVVVDTEAPKVRITGAAYGQGDQTGHLVIRYRAEDPSLGRRPISLAFGESISGPWSTIAAGLANDSIYAWPADPHLPRQIFLRIDVTDEAGNREHYILDTPIDIQGLAPRARIRGFNPLTGTSGGGNAPVGEDVKSAAQPKPRVQ